MNKSLLMGVVIGAVVVTAGGAIAMLERNPRSAEVLEVEPVTRTVQVPREVCGDEAVTRQAPTRDPNQVTGTVIGAVVGGVLGNQVGSGRGKDVATVAGAAAGGYAGVWATENTREAITAAFKRKEVYATSGTRIVLQVFGGFSFAAGDAERGDIASLGYREGVPMGGDLSAAPRNRAPGLLISARKDPIGANLDRVQVVKGWLAADGTSRERVFNVAWAGDNRRRADGSLGPVGNTVDLASGSYENSIGSPSLAVLWVDPEFDPADRPPRDWPASAGSRPGNSPACSPTTSSWPRRSARPSGRASRRNRAGSD